MKANPGSFIETKPNSRPRLIRLLSLLAALLSPAAQAQLQIADLTRGSNSVALAWQGGRGPYLVRTSGNLGHWSDQGEPGLDTNRTLSAFAVRSFYRVADLNASNLYSDLFGLIQTEQGEFGELMARHRLKTRLWLYQTQGVPHTSATYTAAEYWGKLLVNLQTHWDGEVRTWTGALEDLGPMTTPRNNSLSITWTNGTGPAQRVFTLAFDFPYGVSAVRNNSGSTAPNASDPTMTLRCSYAAAQPELD